MMLERVSTGRYPHLPLIALLLAGIIGVRLVLTLTHAGYLGVDGGAYLNHALHLMGANIPQIDFLRPPLAPGWLLIPFLRLFGLDAGYSIWAAIFSTLPIIPVAALLAYRVLPKRMALATVLFIALNPWHWEMIVTGALPLIGIALVLLAIWGLTGVSTGHARLWERFAVVGAVALIPYINQTSTGLAAIAIPAYVGSLALFARSFGPLKRTLPYLAAGALLALPAVLLFYRDVFFGSDLMAFPGPKVYIPSGYTGGWLIAALGWTVGVSVLRNASNIALKSLAVVMLAHSTLTLFSSYDEAIINIFFRSQHIASVLIIILGVWYVARETDHKPRVHRKVIAVALACLMAVASAYVFSTQARYSDMMTPGMLRAMAHVPGDSRGSIITGNFMTGLWIAALKESYVYWAFSAEPPSARAEGYEHTQCVLGWRTDAGCDPIASAQALDARYVLVDTRFPHISAREPNLWGAPGDTWAPTHAAPWLDLKASYGTIRLWEIRYA